MGILDRAREQARAAAEQARTAGDRATHARLLSSTEPTAPCADEPDDPSSSGPTDADGHAGASGHGDLALDSTERQPDERTRSRDPFELAHLGLSRARSGLAGVVDRIDPGMLADVVIKVTSLQEAANLALCTKESPYRISGISITATIPPQVSFAISRLAVNEQSAAVRGPAPKPAGDEA